MTTATRRQAVPLAQAAQRLGLSWGQAWRLVLTGALRGHKVGAHWYIEAESLDARSDGANAGEQVRAQPERVKRRRTESLGTAASHE